MDFHFAIASKWVLHKVREKRESGHSETTSEVAIAIIIMSTYLILTVPLCIRIPAVDFEPLFVLNSNDWAV